MKRLIALTLALLMMLGLASCGSSTYVILEYDLTEMPDTLDAQFASSDSERLIVANLFEGLVRVRDDGEIEGACAEDWQISADGRTYTFTLRDGLLWSDGSALTSDDFAFALSRLFSPDSPSPYASSYSSIENADAVLAGEAELSSLGIETPDDRTLVIRLAWADSSFLSLLAQTPAMPCSRAFFSEQKGRYGLSDDHLLTNGAFDLYSWGASSIRLRRAEYGREETAIDGVNLNLGQDDPAARYLAGETSACLSDAGSFPEDTAGTLIYDKSWALILNPNSEAFADRAVRAAILGALHSETITSRIASPAISSQGLLSPAVTVGTLSYRDTVGSVAKAAYPSDARTALQDALEALELSRVPSATLLVADDSWGAAVGGAMQKDWQDTLSAYFNMEPLSVDELESRVQSGEFDFALAPLSALADDATHGLSWFVQLIGEEDEAGIGSLLDTARRQSSALSMAKALFSVEQAIVDEFLALPVYDTPSIFVCRENLSGIRYDPATRIVYFKDAAAS